MSHTIARIIFMVPAIILCAMVVPIQVIALTILCLALAEYIHQKHLHSILNSTKGNKE